MTIPPRFAITADDINNVVVQFYDKVRRHPELGPIFAEHVADWPTHLGNIAAFWRNAILFEGGYTGNPMRVHMQTHDVTPQHFAPWLALFDSVLDSELPQETAQAWSALAHRIGRGLRFGLDSHISGMPPNLRAD